MGLEIKATKTGFTINIAEGVDFLDARKLLIDKFEETNDFFKGSKFIKFNSPGLKNSDRDYLIKFLKESYGIVFEEEYQNEEHRRKKINRKYRSNANIGLFSEKITSIDETINKIKNLTKLSKDDLKIQEGNLNDLPTKFLFENLRSGSEIEYDGNVVIFGDVNPGAKITAKGNIIVMGSFRGMAYAGKTKEGKANEKCFLAALKLLPLQIRIGNLFAVPPEDAKMLTNAIVKSNDDEIIIETF